MNFTQGLRRALQTNPNGLATVFGDRRRTWRELGDRVARVAAGLQSLGVNPGSRVAILAHNSDRYLETFLATAWAGGVIVPLNTRWAPAENEFALRDCQPSVLIVDKTFAAVGESLAKSVPGFTLVYADDDEHPAGSEHYEAVLSRSAPIEDAMRERNDLAAICYTGGTTGRSKGVMLSHGNLTATAMTLLAEGLIEPDSIYLTAAPMFHIAGIGPLCSMFFRGNTNVILRVFAPEAVMESIAREKVTTVLLVPTMIQMLVDHPALGSHDLSSLKMVIYGASPISEAVLDRAMSRLPHSQFAQAYGMTELTGPATLLHWKDHLGENRIKGRHRSAGRATFTCEVRIVGSDGEPVPNGTVGEVAARGDALMMSYWNRPEETTKAIIDGWLRTGDGGYMDDDGFLYVVDRVKDMIVSGGENVYSAEVENAVAQHPAVAQCAVIGIPSEQWGEQVHACIHRKPGSDLTAEEIIAFCKERIAGYKCPRSVDITDTPLPISGAGKILKHELRRPFWEGHDRRVA